ncbi:MAG: hypothetical protein JSW52_10520 [Candidatus Coatesbacteria bacterium]|nr:MAG: hypothetical protein JSW52_10520 [Candidatus Coatesbacteria bacterium]
MGEIPLRDFLGDDFWAKALARPKKEGVSDVLAATYDYILDKLGERIDDIQERGDGEGIAIFAEGREILLINVGIKFLRIYVHPTSGAEFDPRDEFAAERFRFWDSAYRKTTGKYVGMTFWVSEAPHLEGMKRIIDRIPQKAE